MKKLFVLSIFILTALCAANINAMKRDRGNQSTTGDDERAKQAAPQKLGIPCPSKRAIQAPPVTDPNPPPARPRPTRVRAPMAPEIAANPVFPIANQHPNHAQYFDDAE